MPEEICLKNLEKRLIALEVRFKERMKANDTALKLQAMAYDVHLSKLNHEAERLRLMQETYLPREVYETQHKTLVADVEKNSTSRAHQSGRQLAIGAIVGALGLIVIVLEFLRMP